MRKTSLLMVGQPAVLCLTFFFCSFAWADQVVMKIGDRVTGSIIKKTGKEITIKTDQFGLVTAAWDQVESVKSDKPVNVVTQDGKTVQGTLASAGGKIEVAAKDASLTVEKADVVALRNDAEQKAYERLLRPGWGQLWTGTVDVGLAGASGNAQALTFTTGMDAARATNTDKTSVYLRIIKASATVGGKRSDTAQAVRGGIGYDHNITKRLFVNLFNDYEYDKFQNLDLRFVLGGGLGYQVVKSERTRLDLVGGAAYNRSSFNGSPTRNSAELYWGNNYSVKLTGSTSLVQSFRMFNDMTNTGWYRVNFDIGASTKISKWLSWNLSLSDRYLSHPAPGRKTNDFLYSTGLGITFAR